MPLARALPITEPRDVLEYVLSRGIIVESGGQRADLSTRRRHVVVSVQWFPSLAFPGVSALEASPPPEPPPLAPPTHRPARRRARRRGKARPARSRRAR